MLVTIVCETSFLWSSNLTRQSHLFRLIGDRIRELIDFGDRVKIRTEYAWCYAPSPLICGGHVITRLSRPTSSTAGTLCNFWEKLAWQIIVIHGRQRCTGCPLVIVLRRYYIIYTPLENLSSSLVHLHRCLLMFARRSSRSFAISTLKYVYS